MYLINDWCILYIIGIPEHTWKRIENTYGVREELNELRAPCKYQ